MASTCSVTVLTTGCSNTFLAWYITAELERRRLASKPEDLPLLCLSSATNLSGVQWLQKQEQDQCLSLTSS